MRSILCVLCVLCVVCGTARGEPPAEAERLYTEGQKAYDAKDYDRALAAWQKSYELSKLPALVFNIAQAYRLRGDCANAVASYRQFVELDPTSSERADAEGHIKDLEPCPGAAVVDDVRPKILPPEQPPATTRPDNTHVEIRHDHPGRSKKYVAVGLGVVGLGLVATGALYGRKASSLADEVDTDCADGCAWDDIREKDADGRAAERDQYIFLGAGALTLATAGVLYWLGAHDAESTRRVAITPHHDGALVHYLGRF